MLALLVIVSFVLRLQANPVYYDPNDPCVKHEFLHHGKYRGTECEYRPGKAIDDRYIDDDLWFRVEGYNGSLSMTTSPVGLERCSTKLPIWMNGTHPSIGETVDRTACLSGQLLSCLETYDIQVKNCSNFNVYKLKTTRGSEMAYCFGEGEPCPPTDPCEDIDRQELKDDGHRSSTCSPKDFCDDSINGWYRMAEPEKDDSSLQMFDKCPGQGRCGAESPIWLADSHPTPSEGIVTKNVCVRNETDCCGERYQIQVVNCQSYYVYELKARPTCPERYCFGDVDNENVCLHGNDTIIEGNNANSFQDIAVLRTVLTFQLVAWFVLRFGA